MAGEKRKFVEVDGKFYERLKAYAKDNQIPIRDVVTMIVNDFMKRQEVVA